MKKLFAIALAFFAFSAMANGYYYQSPGGGVYFNNTKPQYGNPQPVQQVQVVPVYPTYQQNNQVYRQYQQTAPVQQYHSTPQQPREYYQSHQMEEHNRCMNRWNRSGYRAQYERRTGCMVEVQRGMWVPEDSIRYNR